MPILGNWEVTVIEKATLVSRFLLWTATTRRELTFENNGNSFNRPNQICNPTVGQSVAEPVVQYVVFRAPPAGELGNASRTPVSGPGLRQYRLLRDQAFPFAVREGMRLDFRTEFFNLFNHPQFGLPVQTSTVRGFQCTGNLRRGQFYSE